MKTVVINRGVVGSGKSTLSAKLKEMAEANQLTSSIHNTDQYFMVDGEYRFDPSKLGAYHRANFEAFCQSLRSGVDIVIADNTNLKAKEYKKYVEEAKHQGYKVIAVVFVPDSVDVHLARNSHNVPEETVKRFVETLNNNLITVGVLEDIKFPPDATSLTSFEDRIIFCANKILGI